jgi:uncharacterized protein
MISPRAPRLRERMMPALAVLLLAGISTASPLHAQRVSFPERPPAGVFHLDEAGVLGAAETLEVDRIAAELLASEDIPILAVVLQDLASYGAAGYTIERYAREPFDHWGIGSQAHNYGMLLLVSVADRAARIELGAGWGHDHNDRAQHVMNTLIVPEFRDRRYSEGVLAGVRGMDAMARGLALPAARQAWWVMPAAFGVFLSVTGLMFSLIYSGRSGWAWALGGALFALLLLLLTTINRHGGGSHGGSGGFRPRRRRRVPDWRLTAAACRLSYHRPVAPPPPEEPPRRCILTRSV